MTVPASIAVSVVLRVNNGCTPVSLENQGSASLVSAALVSTGSQSQVCVFCRSIPVSLDVKNKVRHLSFATETLSRYMWP